MRIALIVAAAFVIDLLLGDPRAIPHPVVYIGKLISGLSKLLRRLFPKTGRGEFAAGLVLLIVTAGVSFAVPLAVLLFAGMISGWLSLVIEVFWCWQIFAARSLDRETMKVYRPLKEGDEEQARKDLSMIVGRDTKSLSEEGIVKAAVETVAENTSDGVIAPMIFMLIGGAPLGFLYKAVNTLDSMVGYRNEEFMFFGRASARMDDVLNFIPARITGLLMIAGALFTGLDAGGAARIFRRDRLNHKSPNSAHPEAAMAGALGIMLGGSNYYFGKLVEKDTIGDALRKPEPGDIPRSIRLMYAASVIGLIIFCAAAAGIWTLAAHI